MSAPPPQYPRIPAWRRPYVRRPDEVQFGVAPGAPVVAGVATSEAALLAGLDGLLTREQTVRVAAEAGVAPRRWRELLDLVAALGVLVDDGPPVLLRAPSGAVAPLAVGPPGHGTGRTCISEMTDAAPRVLLEAFGGARHGSVLAEHVARALRDVGTGTVVTDPVEVDLALTTPAAPPALVVLVGTPVLDPRRGDVWLRRGVPHLPVVGAAQRGTVGPLVDPRHPGSPCLWCLDHHRADRDTAWPVVLTQALAPERVDPGSGTRCADRWQGQGPGAGPVLLTSDGAASEPLAAGLTHLVAGAVTLLAARVLRGEPTPSGVSVEVSLPWPRMDHRRWSRHPRCEHGHGPPAEAGGASRPRLI